MNKKVIVINGNKRVGKDLVCSILQKLIKDKTQRVAFADSLKEEIADQVAMIVSRLPMAKDSNYLYVRSDLQDSLESLRGFWRPLWQAWGDRGRGLNPTIWVEKVVDKINLGDGNTIYIVSDCRLDNEFTIMLEAFNPLFLRIIRDEVDDKDRHNSEAGLDPSFDMFFHVIENNGSIEELTLKIREWLHTCEISI